MEKSESIVKLAEALSKAQGMMENASKDVDNPFFHSSYADLASCWDVCRKPLSDNGLSIVQSPMVIEGGIRLKTILLHSSGEWIACEYPIEPMRQVKENRDAKATWETSRDPQSMGSAVTYARRYCLCAMVGIASEDDDGEGAVGRPKNGKSPESEPLSPEEASKKLTEGMQNLSAKKNKFELKNHWFKHLKEYKLLPPDMFKQLQDNYNFLIKKFEEGKDESNKS